MRNTNRRTEEKRDEIIRIRGSIQPDLATSIASQASTTSTSLAQLIPIYSVSLPAPRMLWQSAWRRAALAVLLIGIDITSWSATSNSSAYVYARGWSSRRKLDAREKTRDLWNHGFNSYMQNGAQSFYHLCALCLSNIAFLAFPLDEVGEPS